MYSIYYNGADWVNIDGTLASVPPTFRMGARPVDMCFIIDSSRKHTNFGYWYLVSYFQEVEQLLNPPLLLLLQLQLVWGRNQHISMDHQLYVIAVLL